MVTEVETHNGYSLDISSHSQEESWNWSVMRILLLERNLHVAFVDRTCPVDNSEEKVTCKGCSEMTGRETQGFQRISLRGSCSAGKKDSKGSRVNHICILHGSSVLKGRETCHRLESKLL